MDSQCRSGRLGVAVSSPWLQWIRAHVQVLLALLGQEDEENTGGLRKTCSLLTEEGNVNSSPQDLKANRRGMRGVTFEVVSQKG